MPTERPDSWEDLYGNEGGRRTVEELLSFGEKKPSKDEPKISDGWKRDGKPKKIKTIYKTADEAASEVGLGVV